MEEYVGEPYCYTIDVNNEQLLRATLKKIKDSEVDSEVVVRSVLQNRCSDKFCECCRKTNMLKSKPEGLQLC